MDERLARHGDDHRHRAVRLRGCGLGRGNRGRTIASGPLGGLCRRDGADTARRLEEKLSSRGVRHRHESSSRESVTPANASGIIPRPSRASYPSAPCTDSRRPPELVTLIGVSRPMHARTVSQEMRREPNSASDVLFPSTSSGSTFSGLAARPPQSSRSGRPRSRGMHGRRSFSHPPRKPCALVSARLVSPSWPDLPWLALSWLISHLP